jgi:hypothetical protein
MKISIANDIAATQLDDETAVLNTKTGKYFSLNNVGSRFWNLIQTHGDLSEVFGILSKEFNVSENQLREDIDALVQQLVTAGLVLIS